MTIHHNEQTIHVECIKPVILEGMGLDVISEICDRTRKTSYLIVWNRFHSEVSGRD